MWELEQDRNIVGKVLPWIVICVVVLIIWASMQVDRVEFRAVFAPTPVVGR